MRSVFKPLSFAFCCLVLLMPFATVAQQDSVAIIVQQDSVATATALVIDKNDRFKPFFDPEKGIRLRNEEGTFARKMIRGGLFVHGFEGIGYGILAVLPVDISGWEKGMFKQYGANLKRAYSAPPIFDNDKWYINYIGHPYQGTVFYNSVRSQKAKIWQSALFCLGQVYVWEYIVEAGLEQPSIQDLIVTPLAGIAVGELIHFGTMRMARNGFKWYEAVVVTIINPMFILNNGYHFGMHRRQRKAAKLQLQSIP